MRSCGHMRVTSMQLAMAFALSCGFTGILVTPTHGVLTIDQIKPGMKGVGKTVFEGVKVESFSVEVIDVLKGTMPHTDMILVRVGGKRIERVGGICAGMSGSPIIINGHLAGAIAYAEPLSDTRFAYVTPAQDLLALFDYEEQRGDEERENVSLKESAQLDGLLPLPPIWRAGLLPISPVNWATGLLSMRLPLMRTRGNEHPAQFKFTPPVPMMTPLMVCGLGQRAISMLNEKWLQRRFLTVTSKVATSSDEVSEGTLKMGAAIALQLVRGDVSIAALGTLTYSSAGKFAALGHPLLQRGSAQFGLTGAVIHKVVRSLVMPFKVGSPISGTLGVVTQDRERGVAGYFGRSPDWIELRVTADADSTQNYRFTKADVVPDSSLVPMLSALVALDTIDKATDRIGEGTAELSWKFISNDEVLIERDDVFYSGSDIAVVCVTEVADMLELILNNEFKEVTISQLDITAHISRRRRTARVCKIEVAKRWVKPGDSLQAKVTVQPFRKSAVIKKISLRIPKGISIGKAVLIAYGRWGRPSRAKQLLNARTTVAKFPRTLGELLQQLRTEPRNTDLILELWSREQWLANKMLHRGIAQPRSLVEEVLPEEQLGALHRTMMHFKPIAQPIIRKRVPMGYVIHGEVNCEIEIADSNRK